MSESRSFRDRLAHIADMIDLEQLDGLVIRRDSAHQMDEDQPRLHRLFMGLEQQQQHQQNHQNQDQFPQYQPQEVRQEEVDVVFAPIPDFWSKFPQKFPRKRDHAQQFSVKSTP